MFCRKCGTQLPDDAAFCYNCGEKTNISSAIEPNSNAANTNVSSGNGNVNKSLIIGAIVAAIVACCAFLYVNYNSSFVPDFVSKDLKFTWNDDLDSISKKYQKWTFKKDKSTYLVNPSISKIAGIDVEKTTISFSKDNDKKIKRLFIFFDLKTPEVPELFDPVTEERLPEDIAQKRITKYRIQSAIANTRIKKGVDNLYNEIVKCYGNNPTASSKNSNGFIDDDWIWQKDDTIIKLHYSHADFGCHHYLSLSFYNPKYNLE